MAAMQRIWKRAPRPITPALPDPADMGTAFGMEVALGQSAFARPADAQPATAHRPWWKRLTVRRPG